MTEMELPDCAWPIVARGRDAELLAMVRQFSATQWWPAERLRAAQMRQLHVLLAHACRHVPFYRRRLREAGFDPAVTLTEQTWQRIPILSRQDVQAHAARLCATMVPPSHGDLALVVTGGSTGVPVRVRRAAAENRLFAANLCRQHLWHETEPTGLLATFGYIPDGASAADHAAMQSGDGLLFADRGPVLRVLHPTGEIRLFYVTRPVAEQAAFLQRVAPVYIETKPTILRLLLHHLRETGVSLPGLRAVFLSGEAVDQSLRALCRDVLSCPIIDNYSATEVGFMAIQCPAHEHAHVCAESVRLEVVDDDGIPCPPGVVGRVVVTSLHSLAMPLIRYEIGDRAELGPPCPCGRGLPVLSRVIGRTYDALLLRDGTRRFMGHGYALSALRPIQEYQLVQTAPGVVEIRFVSTRELTAAECEQTVAATLLRTGPDVELGLVRCPSLKRTRAGKLKPFVSELSAGP